MFLQEREESLLLATEPITFAPKCKSFGAGLLSRIVSAAAAAAAAAFTCRCILRWTSAATPGSSTETMASSSESNPC